MQFDSLILSISVFLILIFFMRINGNMEFLMPSQSKREENFFDCSICRVINTCIL